jgi:hypothetical protein
MDWIKKNTEPVACRSKKRDRDLDKESGGKQGRGISGDLGDRYHYHLT